MKTTTQENSPENSLLLEEHTDQELDVCFLQQMMHCILGLIDGSFEYPQHMFWLRNKKTNFQLRTLTCIYGGPVD